MSHAFGCCGAERMEHEVRIDVYLGTLYHLCLNHAGFRVQTWWPAMALAVPHRVHSDAAQETCASSYQPTWLARQLLLEALWNKARRGALIRSACLRMSASRSVFSLIAASYGGEFVGYAGN